MVGTSSRKQRERHDREELILDHAQRLLHRDGFQGLNLDELARSVEYSKGTLYLHFETKEDLALSICTRAIRLRADLFDRAAKFRGTTRERIACLGYAARKWSRDYPDMSRMQMMLKAPSFWERASEERRRQHGIEAGRAFYHLNQIATEAVIVGDLPAGTPAPLVTLSLISATIGSEVAANAADFQMLTGQGDPGLIIRVCQDRMCDGWLWQPLSSSPSWDYPTLERRIRAEIFTED
jgi:AcrR family transcriptional regulator